MIRTGKWKTIEQRCQKAAQDDQKKLEEKD